MTSLSSLADRIETAAADQQYDLLGDAWDALGPIVHWTAEQAGKFGRMMDAGAYESAALMMVPEGYGWRLWVPAKLQSGDGDRPRVTIWGSARTYAPRDTEAATPALALLAASLRALASLEHPTVENGR